MKAEETKETVGINIRELDAKVWKDFRRLAAYRGIPAHTLIKAVLRKFVAEECAIERRRP